MPHPSAFPILQRRSDDSSLPWSAALLPCKIQRRGGCSFPGVSCLSSCVGWGLLPLNFPARGLVGLFSPAKRRTNFTRAPRSSLRKASSLLTWRLTWSPKPRPSSHIAWLSIPYFPLEAGREAQLGFRVFVGCPFPSVLTTWELSNGNVVDT